MPADRGLSPELAEKVRAFLHAEGAEKAALRGALALEAERLREARNFPSMGMMVEELALAGEEDPQAPDLAVELTSPAVASHLVAKLGQARREEDRSRLLAVTARLGEEMARALADALGEARDRYQRRAYMDAMIALGPVALEMAARMVEDPRWFVVRNAVAILGELGGEEAVSQVTGTLANGDPRVRKEAVLALARLGGDDARILLLGMLEDSDPEVRAMACRGVGVQKVEKAVRTLLHLLEEDPNEDVQVEALQALGKIGDPGAVPQIEKRAVGGLFTRPTREIRVAAYRALAGIGTPHAMGLLEKAEKDSDAGVRTVVHALLQDRRRGSPPGAEAPSERATPELDGSDAPGPPEADPGSGAGTPPA